jgi:hypothetical protein
MFQSFRSCMLHAIVAIVFAFICQPLPTTSAASGSGSGGVREPRLEGTLVSINGRVASVRVQGGVVRAIVVPTTAKIERNDRSAPLTAFRAGDRVQARFTPNGATVIKFEGVGP